jgi:hypothetical protein
MSKEGFAHLREAMQDIQAMSQLAALGISTGPDACEEVERVLRMIVAKAKWAQQFDEDGQAFY